MKNVLKFLFLYILGSFLISSCSITKRHYLNGYHVEWKNIKKNVEYNKPDALQFDEVLQTAYPFIEEEITASVFTEAISQDASIKGSELSSISFIAKKKIQECDKMLLLNGDEINVKVLEIGLAEIKYKNCNNLSGPIISIAKQNVFMITYANGIREVITKPNQERATKATEARKYVESKDQLVALLLALFVGFMGIHRFYLGYTAIGIIQLMTFGGLGIWSFIDLIRIITGDLEPARGPYEKTI
jgi:hypothetical protein